MLGPPVRRVFDRPREVVVTRFSEPSIRGSATVAAQLTNASDAAADLLDQPHAVEQPDQKWIRRKLL